MGLIRGVARTAVVAGTATAVSNRVSRRQANRWASQDQSAYEQQAYEQQQQQAYAQPAAPPPASPETDTLDQLAKLGQLHDSGVLTDAEFEAQKAKILGS
ncbi:MAG TPA: SHOCT domain-containing protein [Acidimicrobiia bacterium]|nr:SHOCT domain-containing protein [Acidimicrobiia bacterium]